MFLLDTGENFADHDSAVGSLLVPDVTDIKEEATFVDYAVSGMLPVIQILWARGFCLKATE